MISGALVSCTAIRARDAHGALDKAGVAVERRGGLEKQGPLQAPTAAPSGHDVAEDKEQQ